MAHRESLPHAALRPFVDRLWLHTPDKEPAGSAPAAAARSAETRILPDGCIDILVDVASGDARVVGTMTRAVCYTGGASESLAAVRFKPGAASAFLNLPAVELTDRVVPAAELGLRWLSERRTAPGEARLVLAELEQQLLARLHTIPAALAARHGARRLFAAHPPSVEELARELGQTRQQLARTFRRELGISPKALARIARLQRAIDELQRRPRGSLSATALDLGYYDQAHMARDFRALAGITPAEAQRSRGSLFPIPSLWLEP